MFRYLGTFLRRGLKNIWENRMMSLASVGIVAASLLLFGIFLLTGLNVNAVLRREEERCEITVYLSADAGGVTLSQIEGELREVPGVKDVRFFSREDRLKRAKETTYQGKEYVLEDLEKDNPLRDSYILTLEQLSMAEQAALQAAEIQGVEEVQSRKAILDRIRTITGFVQRFGLILLLIMGLVTMFIVANTVRLGLAARSREINVMRLVGASNGYIRGPFMMEGIFLGIFGALLAAGILLPCYRAGLQSVENLLGTGSFQLFEGEGFRLLRCGEIWKIILFGFLGIGAGIGFLGSGISVGKYLKV